MAKNNNTSLVQAARRQDDRAWSALLKQHQNSLYAYIVELTSNPHLALDIVQETFTKAVRYIETLRDDSKFTSWLFSIAHQLCIQQFRRKRRHEEFFADSDETTNDFPDASIPDPRSQLIQEEQSESFFNLVEKLPLAQRSTLLLHFLEDFSLAEISTITDVPVGTVKSRLHHAKRSLRKLLEDLQ